MKTNKYDQTNMTNSQQINFTGKLEDGGAKKKNSEKQQKAILNFSVDSLIVTE